MSSEEQIKFDLKANMKKGMEYVGGTLKITNEYLYFYPHSFNIQSENVQISVSEIKTIDTAKILGISPNGVVMHLNNDTTYKFTIGLPWGKKRREIIDFVRSLINS